jgi:ribosomal protein L25 (general stress protein Ctc)
MNYTTGEDIRRATRAELRASKAAAKRDGGAGVIRVEVDGKEVSCFVQD